VARREAFAPQCAAPAELEPSLNVDRAVLAAMLKWPDVPAVFGWLALTARGQWRLRGEPIANRAIVEFIGRNYAADARGRWYFQNGPQRVYAELEAAPWVYRLDPAQRLLTHTELRPRALHAAALLDDGRFVFATELGCGLLDDRDGAALLRAAGPALERLLEGDGAASLDPAAFRLQGRARRIERLRFDELPERFGFVRAPAP
jgi:hypothetical protein